MAGWDVVLYGSDEDEAVENPDITTVNSKADASSFAFTAKGLYPDIQLEQDGTTSIDGFTTSKQGMRIIYRPVQRPVDFPSSVTELTDFMELSVFQRAYHWLDFADYELPPDTLTSKVFAVAIKDVKIIHDDELSMKHIELELQARTR